MLGRERGDLTVADAAAKAGLPLREAEEGLRYLAAEFSGHLAATDKGEILYSFPNGLERPPETRWWRRLGRGLKKAVLGIGRFVVRAWVSVVLIGYAVAFLAMMIALASRNDRDDGPGEAINVVLRVIAEAFYWTFHPFSPVYVGYEPGWVQHPSRRYGRPAGPKVPFYEKVNRFVFGPPKVEKDLAAEERQVLTELRRLNGRITPSDVMRVTGASREEAERTLLRLVVDYAGEIEVADSGAIIYRFSELRSTTGGREESGASPIWTKRVPVPPLTGNTGGSNAVFALVNGFNLVASSYVLANGLTLERITAMLANMRERFPQPLPPADGTPLVFGAIPFVFSAALFALPLVRALRRRSQERKIGRENGFRGVLRVALSGRRGRVTIGAAELAQAWVAAGGHEPSETELRDAVRAAGGDVDVGEGGALVFTFEVVEAEARAAEQERMGASAEEARPGEVVFSSADEGTGIREGRGETAGQGARAGEPGAGGGAVGSGAPSRPALGEAPERIPDPGQARGERHESVDDLLSRLGVDTRRRGR